MTRPRPPALNTATADTSAVLCHWANGNCCAVFAARLGFAIAFSGMAAGDRFPSNRQLATATGVQRGHVRRAVGRLVRAGFVAKDGRHLRVTARYFQGPDLASRPQPAAGTGTNR